MPMPDPARLAALTRGQRDCLHGVLAMKTSKQIAVELGISPHTVDKRLKDAMRVLGVASRVDAARMLRQSGTAEAYQPLASQSPDLDPGGVSLSPLPADRAGEAGAVPQSAHSVAAAPQVAPAPAGRHARRVNRFTSWQRLGIILAIAVAAPLLLGAVASGMMLAQELYEGGR